MTRYLTILILIAFIAVGAIAQDDDGDGEPTLDLPLTETITYSIRAGDTLDVLAATFDVDLACLRETNDLAPADILSPGDLIVVDIECPTYAGTLTVEFPREDTAMMDMDANDVEDDEPAQEEAVPLGETGDDDAEADETPTASGEDTTYIVQRGDTLDVIGQELNVSVEAIVLVNDLDNPNDIEIGQELIIPGDAPPYGQVPALDDSDGQGGGIVGDGDIYVIQRGDTLDVIAQEFNVSLVSLQVVNDISNGRSITPGQTIIIPADAPVYGLFPALDGSDGQGGGLGVAGELYVVQPRDTLDEIGQELDISVVSLLLVNDLERGIDLMPGMTLIIPDDAPAYGLVPALDATEQGGGFDIDGELYVLQPRETIDGVSARFNVSPRCVLDANEITQPRRVTAGTTIIIPDDCPAYDGFDFVPPQTETES